MDTASNNQPVQPKKYNKLAIRSFVGFWLAVFLLSLFFSGALSKKLLGNGLLAFLIANGSILLFLYSVITAIISFFQIRKRKEVGLWMLIIIVVFILLVALFGAAEWIALRSVPIQYYE